MPRCRKASKSSDAQLKIVEKFYGCEAGLSEEPKSNEDTMRKHIICMDPVGFFFIKSASNDRKTCNLGGIKQ